MDPFNFLRELQAITSGDGVMMEEQLCDLNDSTLFSDGSTLTTTLTTNPGWAKSETNATVLQWAATKVVAAGISFTLPFDYDEAKDFLQFRFFAMTNGSTDAPTITGNAYVKRAGLALSADILSAQTAFSQSGNAVTASATVPKSASNGGWMYFDLSKIPVGGTARITSTTIGTGLKGGDVIFLKITPGTHGTDAISIYTVMQRYRSAIVSYWPSSLLPGNVINPISPNR